MNNIKPGTIIISDLHLSDKFCLKTSRILEKIISKSSELIINGDFWDDSKTTFDKFVNSEWSKLFPLFKEKNTKYIFGNHDMHYRIDERVNLFSKLQDYSIKLTFDNKIYRIEHGHFFSTFSRVLMHISRIHPSLAKYPASPLGWYMKLSEYFQRNHNVNLSKFLNSHFKKAILNDLFSDYLVMGHTHSPEFDKEKNYINSGFIRNGFASYVLFDDEPRVEKLLY
jgi:predicted phosphodiesterase